MDCLIIYDKFETAFTHMGLAVLENASGVKVKEVINGEYLLSFILPRNDLKWQYVQPENFVKIYDASQKKDQLFRVRSFDEQRDNTGKLTSNVQCEHVYYDTHDCKFFPAVELIGKTPEQILTYAFAGTRFTIGTVEITTPTDIIQDRVYSKQIVDKLIENVGGELIKDNWTINLVNKRGSNTGVQFRYGKNQASLKRSTDAKGVVTRLYPYGKDGLQIPGTLGYIDSPLINSYDRPRIGYIDYKDIEDPDQLLAAAQKEWTSEAQDGIDMPMVTYSGEFLELKKLQEYGELEAYGIGDTVRIIDEGLGADTLQRIMEYETYPYEAKRSTVVLSNLKPSRYKDNRPMNIIGSAIRNSDYVDGLKDSSNKLDPGWFANIKSKLKTLFSGKIRDAVMHKTGDIWVDNPDNPTKAMAILADGFAIADSKTSSGDWDWKTFGTASDGFVADYITSGTITGILLRTAAAGQYRIEMQANGLISYNAANQKEGVAIESGLYGFSKLVLYVGGIEKGGLNAGQLNAMELSTKTGIDLLIAGGGNSNRIAGAWNCSIATFDNLKDSSNNRYATQNWVQSQGYSTYPGPSGYSGYMFGTDGTYIVANGIIQDKI